MLKPMLRKLPDGSDLTWQVAAMSRFDELGRAPKPFFITWDDPTHRPDKVSPRQQTSISEAPSQTENLKMRRAIHAAQRR